MNAITKLENLGYFFTLRGDKIRYTHTGEASDPAIVRPLLTDKRERYKYLKNTRTPQERCVTQNVV